MTSTSHRLLVLLATLKASRAHLSPSLMSFSNLKANRTTKQSFLTSSSNSDKPDSQTANKVSISENVPNGSPPPQPEPLRRCVPDKLEVKVSDVGGRGTFATVPFSPGSVIATVKPHVFTLSTPFLAAFCSSCCAPSSSSGLKRCPRCRTIWYCDPTCQNNDWSLHKHECAAINRWKEGAPSSEVSIPNDAVRCLGRIAWKMQKEERNGAWATEYNLMQSHRVSLPASSIDAHTHLAHSIVRYLGVSSPSELSPFGIGSSADLVDLISRFTTNTFALTSTSLDPIGVCVSPPLAFTNHSCSPNAVVVFPRTPGSASKQEPRAHLVCLREVEQGEQVFVSYIDTTLPTSHRRRILKDTYNFECNCTLCNQGATSDPRESVWCPKSCGGTCPTPSEDSDAPQCSTCRATIQSSGEIVDAVRVGQEALEKASFLRREDPEKARHLTSNMIPILMSAGLTPSSHPLLALVRVHQELIVEALSKELVQESLDEAIRTAARHSAGLSILLPFGHPLRGVSLAELGKLLAVDEPSPQSSNSAEQPAFPPSGPRRLKLAHETLVRARDELLIGFGKENGGGQVGKDVREAIVRLEGELDVWKYGIKNVIEDSHGSRK